MEVQQITRNKKLRATRAFKLVARMLLVATGIATTLLATSIYRFLRCQFPSETSFIAHGLHPAGQ